MSSRRRSCAGVGAALVIAASPASFSVVRAAICRRRHIEQAKLMPTLLTQRSGRTRAPTWFHLFHARANASCARSSASQLSPVRIVSSPTSVPYSFRQKGANPPCGCRVRVAGSSIGVTSSDIPIRLTVTLTHDVPQTLRPGLKKFRGQLIAPLIQGRTFRLVRPRADGNTTPRSAMSAMLLGVAADGPGVATIGAPSTMRPGELGLVRVVPVFVSTPATAELGEVGRRINTSVGDADEAGVGRE